jgi:TonB family protein
MTVTSTHAKNWLRRCWPWFSAALLNIGGGACAFVFEPSAAAMPLNAASDAPGGDSEVLHNKIHLSPQALQAIYVSGIRLGALKVARAAKATSCMVSGWYSDEGTVQVVQLVKASGLPTVDQACMQGVIGQRLEGMLPGESGARTYFRFYWLFDPKEDNAGARPPTRLDPSIPQLPADGAIHPLPGYPAEALAQNAHGICKMHVTVSAAGAVSSIEITQSTGSGSLDEACKDAMNKSAFVPATAGGAPVSGTTDVAILWRLPR